MSLVYEVNLRVDAAIEVDYRAWLDEHVAAMLRLPGFLCARMFEVVPEPGDTGQIGLCVHYFLRDEEALRAYLQQHAPRMRAEGATRFGQRFSASRRILRPAPSRA